MSEIKLLISQDDPEVAYLTMPGRPGKGKYGVVGRTVRLSSILGQYEGAEVNFDFSGDGRLIGIEIIC